MQTNMKLKTLTKPIGTSHEKKKTMLTKTTSTPLVLKLLAALCMLDCVGTQAIMASGVNCATSSDTRCKLNDPPCKSPGFCFDKTKYTAPSHGRGLLAFPILQDHAALTPWHVPQERRGSCTAHLSAHITSRPHT
jgi:hypothetical protein